MPGGWLWLELSLLPVDPSTGQVVPSEVEKLVSPSTCLVTVMLANNETGVLQPIAEICDAVRRASKKHGSNVFLHSDVSQAVGKIDVNIGALKVDAVSVTGHKFYGPRNGALIMRSQYTTKLVPLLHGGGQQQNLRSGTENTPMIMGLGAAAAACDVPKIEAKLCSVRDYFEQQLKELIPDQHVVHFANSPRLPNTSSVAFPKYPNASTEMMTKCKTFYASTGAACHSGKVRLVVLVTNVDSFTKRFIFVQCRLFNQKFILQFLSAGTVKIILTKTGAPQPTVGIVRKNAKANLLCLSPFKNGTTR
ncbi:aminotransferase, class V [Cooperia oncophora]